MKTKKMFKFAVCLGTVLSLTSLKNSLLSMGQTDNSVILDGRTGIEAINDGYGDYLLVPAGEFAIGLQVINLSFWAVSLSVEATVFSNSFSEDL